MFYLERYDEAISLLQGMSVDSSPPDLVAEKMCMLIKCHAFNGQNLEAERLVQVLVDAPDQTNAVARHLLYAKALMNISTETDPLQACHKDMSYVDGKALCSWLEWLRRLCLERHSA